MRQGHLLRLVVLSARSGGDKGDCFWFGFDPTTRFFSSDLAHRISVSFETKISVVHLMGMVGRSGEAEVVVGNSEDRNSFFGEENTRNYLVVSNTFISP